MKTSLILAIVLPTIAAAVFIAAAIALNLLLQRKKEQEADEADEVEVVEGVIIFPDNHHRRHRGDIVQHPLVNDRRSRTDGKHVITQTYNGLDKIPSN